MTGYRSDCGSSGKDLVSIEFHTSTQQWFAEINDELYKEGIGLENLKVVTSIYGD